MLLWFPPIICVLYMLCMGTGLRLFLKKSSGKFQASPVPAGTAISGSQVKFRNIEFPGQEVRQEFYLC